jgi:hypothetical protein
MYGLTAAIDGTHANQLDVAGGVALLRQSDSSLGRVAPSAATFQTVQINSTYYLDVNPDGSWSWAISHSGVSGALTIAQVTTDGSGNISTVTDERMGNSSLLAAMTGQLALPTLNGVTIGGGGSSPIAPALSFNAAAQLFDIWTMQQGAAQSMAFLCWNGTATEIVLALGDANPAGAQTWINGGGTIASVAGQASVGSFGVPVIVAQAIDVNVTTTAGTDICVFNATATGLYRVSASLQLNNGTSGQRLLIFTSFFDPNNGASQYVYNNGVVGTQVGPFDGSATLFTNNFGAINSIIVYAQAGHPVKFTYQDQGGTPNDRVSVVIERLT